MAEIDPAYRVAVSYIDKSREYYAAHGYERPYRWARYADVPFAPLARPLAESRVALITTAALPRDTGDTASRPPEDIYAAPTDPPPLELYTEARFWDKDATHTRDVESFLPLQAIRAHVAAGRLGAPGPRFYGVPTDYSQRRTIEHDAPGILAFAREDDVDVAILVPL